MLPGAGLADVLADVKPYNSSIDARAICDIFHLDSAHFPRHGTLPETSFEILQKVRRTRGVGFHASVR
jgi:hypothetical protein